MSFCAAPRATSRRRHCTKKLRSVQTPLMVARFARSGSQSHPPPKKILDPPMCFHEWRRQCGKSAESGDASVGAGRRMFVPFWRGTGSRRRRRRRRRPVVTSLHWQTALRRQYKRRVSDLRVSSRRSQSKSVYTLQPVVQPVAQPAGRNVLNIHITNTTDYRVWFCDRSFFVISQDHMLPRVKNKYRN